MLIRVASALLLLSSAMALSEACADVLKDPQWQAWLESGKSADLARAAQARAKAQPDDPQAQVALALAAVDDNDAVRMESAASALQTCVDNHPQASCYYGLGRIYGQQAMTASLFKMPGLAGKTKTNFVKAVELDPLLFDARIGLTQFYLMAPGIAGGSVAKARELAVEAQPRQPEQAKILRYLVAAQAGDWPGAERELSGVNAGDDRDLQRELRSGWMRVAFEFIDKKAWPRARAIFEGLQRDYPQHAAGCYGMGRLAQEMGQYDEAARQLERCRSLDAADRYPLDHRLGQALAAKGDKSGARAALERFVQNRRANPRNVEEARKLLADLG